MVKVTIWNKREQYKKLKDTKKKKYKRDKSKSIKMKRRKNTQKKSKKIKWRKQKNGIYKNFLELPEE